MTDGKKNWKKGKTGPWTPPAYVATRIAGNRENPIHAAGMPGTMNRNDRLGPRSDPMFNVVRIDAERIRIDIGKMDGGAKRESRNRARPVGHGSNVDLADVPAVSPDEPIFFRIARTIPAFTGLYWWMFVRNSFFHI
jgi:hypothetical protein